MRKAEVRTKRKVGYGVNLLQEGRVWSYPTTGTALTGDGLSLDLNLSFGLSQPQPQPRSSGASLAAFSPAALLDTCGVRVGVGL